jgi:protocatechuate 3,4-dioxygenase, beta subunit
MSEPSGLTRRHLLHASAALGAVFASVPTGSALAEDVYKWALADVTPGAVLGPFYPLANKPTGRSADLVSRRDKPRAQGQLLYLLGQVLNAKGTPVKGVEVEIWQANAAGRYSHPADGNPAPLDPNFEGYGVATTDAEGRYRFKTVLPGAYQVVSGWDRAPHIHFQLTGRRDRHITQMWFPDHPLNAQDRLFTNLPPPARAKVTAKLEPASGSMEPDAKVAVFSIIVPNG